MWRAGPAEPNDAAAMGDSIADSAIAAIVSGASAPPIADESPTSAELQEPGPAAEGSSSGRGQATEHRPQADASESPGPIAGTESSSIAASTMPALGTAAAEDVGGSVSDPGEGPPESIWKSISEAVSVQSRVQADLLPQQHNGPAPTEQPSESSETAASNATGVVAEAGAEPSRGLVFTTDAPQHSQPSPAALAPVQPTSVVSSAATAGSDSSAALTSATAAAAMSSDGPQPTAAGSPQAEEPASACKQS